MFTHAVSVSGTPQSSPLVDRQILSCARAPNSVVNPEADLHCFNFAELAGRSVPHRGHNASKDGSGRPRNFPEIGHVSRLVATLLLGRVVALSRSEIAMLLLGSSRGDVYKHHGDDEKT